MTPQDDTQGRGVSAGSDQSFVPNYADMQDVGGPGSYREFDDAGLYQETSFPYVFEDADVMNLFRNQLAEFDINSIFGPASDTWPSSNGMYGSPT